MDIAKLKIDGFSSFLVQNFPPEFSFPFESASEQPVDVIVYYIDRIEDVEDFVRLCRETDLSEDNRVIMVYKKGRKDGVNRDSIFMPFKNGLYSGFKMKAPMLCSLSDKLSAFVQQYTG